MGSIFSTFYIGNSALQAARVQIDTTAHNIANVNTPGYSRQRAELVAAFPQQFPYGDVGRGVLVQNVGRIRDEFLDRVFRTQVNNLGAADVQAGYFRRIEEVFNEPSENGFGTRLDNFFNALDDFSNNVEAFGVREALVTEAEAMAASLNDVSGRLNLLRTEANAEVESLVGEINSLGERIVRLNERIRQSELTGRQANDLRDQRGVLLDELAQLVRINYREDEGGAVSVFIGNDLFVDRVRVEQLEAVRNPSLDPNRQDLFEVRFADSGALADIQGGHLRGALDMRDTVLPGYQERMDAIAATFILEINRIHSQGGGVENRSGLISSTNPVDDATTPLVSAGLPFDVQPGSFDLVVYDGAGNATTTTIAIDATTTLTDLANALAAGNPNVSAAIVDGDTLELGTPTPPFTFRFANDTSGALAALGVNGLFTGSDAASIAVDPAIAANPNFITSRFSLDPADTGDNSAALAMAGLRNNLVLEGATSSINDFYEGTVAGIGVEARANRQRLVVEQSFADDFERRRQEVSGVSIDEEIAQLLQYQRAFEAAARIINVTDTLLETLVNLGR